MTLPSPDPSVDPALADAAAQLRIATYRLVRRLRIERSDDMGVGQYSALVSLRAHGPHTLGELADREHVSAPSMNRTVNALVEAGLVERTADPDDRRRIRITLSPEGAELVDATDRRRDAWLESVLARLDDDDRRVITRASDIIRGIAER